MTKSFVKEAINTLDATKSELLFARLFGKKTVHNMDIITVTVTEWRNKHYLISMEVTNAPKNNHPTNQS